MANVNKIKFESILKSLENKQMPIIRTKEYLDGKNFLDWKIDILNQLTNDFEQFLVNEYDNDVLSLDQFKKIDKYLSSQILNNISKKIRTDYCNLESGREVWRILNTFFKESSNTIEKGNKNNDEDIFCGVCFDDDKRILINLRCCNNLLCCLCFNKINNPRKTPCCPFCRKIGELEIKLFDKVQNSKKGHNFYCGECKKNRIKIVGYACLHVRCWYCHLRQLDKKEPKCFVCKENINDKIYHLYNI